MSSSTHTESSGSSYHTARSHPSLQKQEPDKLADLYAPVIRDFAPSLLAIPAGNSSLSASDRPANATFPADVDNGDDSEFELQSLVACFGDVQDQRKQVTAYLTRPAYLNSQPRTAATEAARYGVARELQKLLDIESPIGHLRLELVDPRQAYHEETVRLLIQLRFVGFVSRGPGSAAETWKAGRCPFFPDSVKVHDMRITLEGDRSGRGSVRAKSE